MMNGEEYGYKEKETKRKTFHDIDTGYSVIGM